MEKNIFRKISIFLSVILICTALLSVLFVATEAGHHDCEGDNCPICETIEVCVNNLYAFKAAIGMAAFCSAVFIFVRNICIFSDSYILLPTLVNNKVRLDI